MGQGSYDGEGKPVPPRHIPLKSKCRGTSPGRSGSVAQRLGRQAVTALGHSPARLAWPLPTPAHPVWPRLTGVRQPTPSGQARALHSGVPSRRPQQGSKQRQHPPRERPCGDVLPYPGLWMGAQRSLLLMITPTSPPGRSAFRACAGPHIPMATVAGPSTQCEWATSQALPNWDEGETFWENAQSQIFSPLFCPRVIVFLAPVIQYQTLGLYLFFEQWSAAAAAVEKPHCLYCEVLHPCSMLLQIFHLSSGAHIFLIVKF